MERIEMLFRRLLVQLMADRRKFGLLCGPGGRWAALLGQDHRHQEPSQGRHGRWGTGSPCDC